MNLELARKNLSSLNPNLVSHSLRLFAAYGKLSDLQSIMTLFKHPNPAVKKAAVETTTQIIRENLISHFNELELGVRQKLGILLQSLDPMVIDELSKDLFCETEDRRLRAVQILGLLHRNPRVEKSSPDWSRIKCQSPLQPSTCRQSHRPERSRCHPVAQRYRQRVSQHYRSTGKYRNKDFPDTAEIS